MTDNIKLPSPKFLYDEEMGELHDPGDYAPSDCAALYTADQVREAVRLNAQAVPDIEDLKDRLVAISSAVADSDHREAQAIIRTTLKLLSAAPAAPAAPQPAQQTCNCRWVDDVQVQQCTLHQAHVEAVHEWAERAKTAEAKLIAAATGVKND